MVQFSRRVNEMYLARIRATNTLVSKISTSAVNLVEVGSVELLRRTPLFRIGLRAILA
jgi:hypothetical protein